MSLAASKHLQLWSFIRKLINHASTLWMLPSLTEAVNYGPSLQVRFERSAPPAGMLCSVSHGVWERPSTDVEITCTCCFCSYMQVLVSVKRNLMCIYCKCELIRCSRSYLLAELWSVYLKYKKFSLVENRNKNCEKLISKILSWSLAGRVFTQRPVLLNN